MKLVSSSKLKSVEEALFRGRTFGESMLNAVAIPDVEKKKKKEDDSALMGLFPETGKRYLCVMLTTDRGLCGPVNSSLARALRKELLAASRDKKDVRVVTLGDKGRAQIARDYVPVMARSFDQLFDKDANFALASAIAAKVIQEPYDHLVLFFNKYENQAKFHNAFKTIPQLAGLKPGEEPATLKGYEVEPLDNSEAMINLQEYAIASALFYVRPSAPPPHTHTPPPPHQRLTLPSAL